MGESRGYLSTTLIAVALVIIYLISSVVTRLLYNIYRHPLANIPGPKLAGATYLYQTYFSSRYYLHITDLHKKYGNVAIVAILKVVCSQRLRPSRSHVLSLI
jgi:hypothetical protein